MLSNMRRNRNRTETERRTENVHELDFIFYGFGGRISANTTGNLIKYAHTQPRGLLIT